MKRRIGQLTVLMVLMVIIFMSVTAFAHGGRIDNNGGHKDNKNRSDLGKYHYHCGGYPPHLHNDGVCPYKGNNINLSGKVAVSATAKYEKKEEMNVERYPESNNVGIGSIGLVIAIGTIYFLKRKKK